MPYSVQRRASVPARKQASRSNTSALRASPRRRCRRACSKRASTGQGSVEAARSRAARRFLPRFVRMAASVKRKACQGVVTPPRAGKRERSWDLAQRSAGAPVTNPSEARHRDPPCAKKSTLVEPARAQAEPPPCIYFHFAAPRRANDCAAGARTGTSETTSPKEDASNEPSPERSGAVRANPLSSPSRPVYFRVGCPPGRFLF